MAPAAAASLRIGVSNGVYTTSLTIAVAGICAAEMGEPCSSGPWDMPMVVQFTMRFADAAASVRASPERDIASEPTPLSEDSCARVSARSRVRLAITNESTPPRTRASRIPRAAPPAPNINARVQLGS